MTAGRRDLGGSAVANAPDVGRPKGRALTPLPRQLDIAEIETRLNGHSLFAPSYSATWMNCPGALLVGLDAPDTAGEDAAWGTVAHGVAEHWQRHGKPRHLLGTTQTVRAGGTDYTIAIDDEMMAAVGDCMAWIEGIPGQRYVETRVDFSDLTPVPRQGGMCDLAICQDDGTLIVRDWKFGKGVRVDCRDNSQIRLYAYGFFRAHDWLYDFQRIDIGIGQPRLDHFDSIVITRDDLLAFAETVRKAAAACLEPGAPRIPGEKQCRFCRVRTTCPALAKTLDDLATGSFEDVGDPVPPTATAELVQKLHRLPQEPPDPATLPTAALARVSGYRKLMESWLKTVDEELLRRALAGEPIPNHKLVQGREGNRTWADPKQAADELWAATGADHDELHKITLISPADAEVLLRKHGIRGKAITEILAPLVTRPPGKPTLVPDRDARPALPDPADVFDDL